MSKPRDDRQKDLLLPALDQIIDMGHPLVRLAALIDWKFLDDRFGSVCQAGPGQPGLPTRLVAGLFILKHMHNLSDEVLCARWARDLEEFSIRLFDQAHLMEQAWNIALAFQHPVYDCVYLALAIDNGCKFVTADERLLRKLDQRRQQTLRARAISLTDAAKL